MSDCCDPCPPCQSEFPVTCEPLPSETILKRIVGEDEQGCKKTMTDPDEPSVLFSDGNGETKWADGSTSKPICLPNTQTDTGAISYALGINDSGCLKGIIGDDNTFLRSNNGEAKFEPIDIVSLLPGGHGVLIKNQGNATLSFIAGTQNQILKVDSGGNVVWGNLPQIEVEAFIDLKDLRITRNSATTCTVTLSCVVLEGTLGQPLRVVFNSSPLVLNIGTVGAGGLDSGSASALQYYWIHAIYNPVTDDLKVIASLSASNPLMPTGYTYRRLIGLLRTNNLNQIGEGYQQVRNIVQFGFGGRIEVFYRASGTNSFATGLVSGFYPSISYVNFAIYEMSIWGTLPASAAFSAAIASSTVQNQSFPTFDVYGGATIDAVRPNTTYATGFTANIPAVGQSFYRCDTAALGFPGDFAGLYLSGFELNI